MPYARISAKVWAILIYISYIARVNQEEGEETMKYYGAAPIAEAAPYILLPEYQYYKSGVIYSGMNKVFPSTLRSPLWMMYGVCR